MGTPLKTLTLLSPTVLSPLSPRFLSVSKKNDVFLSTPKTSRTSQSARRLQFSTSPISKNLPQDPIKISLTKFYETERIIKKDILINTPAKKIISTNGLEEQNSLNVLGRGGFGKVVRAVHRDQIVALKVIKNEHTSKNERNALHLKHENIVTTIDIISNGMGGFSLIIMEYYPRSQPLQNLLQDITVEIEEKICQFALNIAKGMKYCHDEGILHLDVKPQNILVCGDICKICDFGNSVKIENLDGFEHKGTISYTCPEILLGKIPTEKSDIYSLGIVLWQMKSRNNPFNDADNHQEIIYKVVKCGLRPDMEFPDDEYSKLYQSCWDYQPSVRPSAAQVVELLLKWQ